MKRGDVADAVTVGLAKPTRIIRRPELLKLGAGRGNPRSWIYCCNNGGEYNRPQLSRLIGISGQQLSDRIEHHGWRSHRILQSKEEYLAEKLALTRARQAASRVENNGGNAEFKRLSGRDRKASLKQLRRPGIWERQEGGDER